MLFAFGFVLTLSLMWFVGRRISRDFWFERAMLMYGWNMGSVGTSVTLLRVIDPDLKTPVLEDFGLAYIGIAIVEIAIIALLPPLIGNHLIGWPIIVLLLGFVVCLLLSRILIGWFSYPPSEIRPGEQEIIDSTDD